MHIEHADAVDRYLCDLLVQEDDALRDAVRASDEAGLPAIQVAPNQGKLLHMLASMLRARRILEIGTLGGYSAIWMARALPPDGRLITLELDPKHAQIARSNFIRAGVASLVDVHVGPALHSLEALGREHAGPFDLVFIDADKQSTPEYFAWALRLTRPGAAIVIDNAIRRGEVANAETTDPGALGIRRALAIIAAEPRVTASALQTVGSKGYDGFAIAVVK